MSDGNYRFDPDSLGYEKEEQHKWRKIAIRIVTQALAALTIGVVVFLTISYTIKTPKQTKLEEENIAMQQEYEALSLKYDRVDSVLKDIEQRDKDLYRAIFETEMDASGPSLKRPLQSAAWLSEVIVPCRINPYYQTERTFATAPRARLRRQALDAAR